MKYLTLLIISLALTSCGVFKGSPDGPMEQALEQVIEQALDVEIDLSPEK